MASKTVSGGNHKRYFFRVPDVIDFLIEKWDKPDLIFPYPQPNNDPLTEKKGIIVFEVSG